ERRTPDGLIYVVHPWEAGNDHSPRWDDWGAPGRTKEGYSRPSRTAWNKERMKEIFFDDDGSAKWSTSFVACPAAFNAYTAFNLRELAAVTGDAILEERATELAAAMDELLWDHGEQLWSDQAVVGGGPSVRIPISDGVMGALVTADESKAKAALAQLADPSRFGAEFGPANV
ncbi:MGH1-like glycoside hydrolase domain-containing protein, partial [Arthrobacter sp. HMWF013]|uniref:MGH1-like glycoside hydrolase domain-containing protein n=1 Tax=Arthrobacter sp. HMWF013 TaxID=2056849 RepID=UPI003F8D223C